MMALGLCDSPNLVRKCQRLREILEGVAPLQSPRPLSFQLYPSSFNNILARRAFKGGTLPPSLHFLSASFIETSMNTQSS